MDKEKFERGLEELIQDGFMEDNQISQRLTNKGHEQIVQFSEKNPAMFLLIQQGILEWVANNNMKKEDLIWNQRDELKTMSAQRR